jgi:outer membrane protein OmpA-like peptidoglycan-associated protein
MSKTYARPLAMAALTMALAVGAAGCQTMSDLDPTGLLGSDEAPAETQFPTDSQEQAAADAATTTPDLASIPARPPAPNTAAQADTAQQVASAGAQAQYSAEALRAGTDAAAPPPTAADAAAARQALASADAPPSAQAQSADAPPTADAPPSAQGPSADAPPTAGSDLPPTASAPTTSAPMANASATSAGNPAVPPRTRIASAAPPPAPSAAESPSAAPSAAPSAEPPSATPAAQAPISRAPVASAPMAPPPGTQPAVPAVPATAGGRMAMANPSDAQLGFKPSSAPALAPGVSNWVSPPVLAHYRQTAAQAGSAGVSAAAVPAVAARGETIASAQDVRANLGGVPGTPAGMAAAMNGGTPPAAIVYFPGDATTLSKTALAEVRQAAQAFKATGGTGSIKVVGHASSRTANMSVERHLELIFQKSQARANAVAQALIKAGVPAAKVQIEAVGDSQPIYYESMPKGEDGNRRAEIFLQG